MKLRDLLQVLNHVDKYTIWEVGGHNPIVKSQYIGIVIEATDNYDNYNVFNIVASNSEELTIWIQSEEDAKKPLPYPWTEKEN